MPSTGSINQEYADVYEPKQINAIALASGITHTKCESYMSPVYNALQADGQASRVNLNPISTDVIAYKIRIVIRGVRTNAPDKLRSRIIEDL